MTRWDDAQRETDISVKLLIVISGL